MISLGFTLTPMAYIFRCDSWFWRPNWKHFQKVLIFRGRVLSTFWKSGPCQVFQIGQPKTQVTFENVAHWTGQLWLDRARFPRQLTSQQLALKIGGVLNLMLQSLSQSLFEIRMKTNLLQGSYTFLWNIWYRPMRDWILDEWTQELIWYGNIYVIMGAAEYWRSDLYRPTSISFNGSFVYGRNTASPPVPDKVLNAGVC